MWPVCECTMLLSKPKTPYPSFLNVKLKHEVAEEAESIKVSERMCSPSTVLWTNKPSQSHLASNWAKNQYVCMYVL